MVRIGGIQKAYRDGFVFERKIKHADLVSHNVDLLRLYEIYLI